MKRSSLLKSKMMNRSPELLRTLPCFSMCGALLPAAAALLVPALLLLLAEPSVAQGQRGYQEYPRSALFLAQRAEITLQDSRLKLERAGQLVAEELISQQEYEQAELQHRSSLVEYQNYLLQALSERSHIVIKRAVKRRGLQGGSRVTLEVGHAVAPLPDGFMEEGALARLLEAPVRNLFVSLEAAGTNVGEPYEAEVERLLPGRTATVDIQLLRDCDELSVVLRYNGRVETRTVILQRDESDDVLALRCSQSSQEVNLGETAEYSLKLERFTTHQVSVPLEVQGLPAEIGRAFFDPATEARINEAAFGAGEAICELSLRLYMPERLSATVTLEETITFGLLVAGEEVRGTAADEPATLVAIPRGVPKLEIAAPNLFLQASRHSPAQSAMEVTNSGTKRLDGIQITVQSPMGWTGQLEPATITSLAPGETRPVLLQLVPPVDAPGGEYEAKVHASTLSDSRVVETDDKVIRIRLEEENPILGSLALASGFLLLVGGIVGLGVRLSRR